MLAKGENLIAPFDRKLWDLTYACLYKYGCPVMFKVSGPNVQINLDRTITFFIPRDNQYKDEVLNYLKEELKSEVREPTIIDVSDGMSSLVSEHTKTSRLVDWYPGTKVEFAEFDGNGYYVEQEHIELMAKRFMADLEKRLHKKST